MVQSRDTANKATELANYSMCTTWGVHDERIYLLDVYCHQVNYPDLKRAIGASCVYATLAFGTSNFKVRKAYSLGSHRLISFFSHRR